MSELGAARPNSCPNSGVEFGHQKVSNMKVRLKQIREELRKTQKEMAALVGGHESTWQKYERGDSLPGSEVLQSLANLGFNINWILTGEGEMYIKTILVQRPIFPEMTPEESVFTAVIPVDIEPILNAAIEVLKSNERGTVLALTQNVYEFRDKVRDRRVIAELKNDMDTIKRRLFNDVREADFKTAESQGEKKKAGGVN